MWGRAQASRLRYVNDQHPMLPDELIRRALAERDVSNWRADDMLHHFAERRQHDQGMSAVEPQKSRYRTQLFPKSAKLGNWIAVAGLAVLLGAGGLISHLATISESPLNSVVTYRTQNSEHAEMTLSDGTVVRLNVDSEIDIPYNFGNTQNGRSVNLRGEAYFHVTHTVGSPFVIQTSTARAVVLGTEFGVRAYDSTNVRVAVRSGKVALNDVVLDARSVGTVNGHSPVMVAQNQDVDAALSFTKGQLVLSRTTLRDAIADLNRWYDVEINVVNTAYNSEQINVVLSIGSINDLMDFLRMLFPATITREGRTITIS